MINKLLQLESDTVSERAVNIPFDFKDKTSVPKGKNIGESIIISPIKVRTWFKLKPLLMTIEKDDFDKIIEKSERTPDSELTEIIMKYDDVMFDILSIGIHNKKSEPPQWFKQVLIDNCTWNDVYVLLNAIFFRIGYNPFCNSITTLKSVSPMTEQEIIAAQRNLKSWTNQAVQ